MAAACVRCSLELRGNYSEDCDVTCGTCVQMRAARTELADEWRRSSISGDECVELRKAAGYTQHDLALRLRVRGPELSAFEQGKGLCPPEVETWMNSQRR
jgi:DNA-binding transcriptional regulator YiaG